MNTYQRSITVQLTAPGTLGTLAGFNLTITPNYSAAMVALLDGSVLLDGTPSLGGATAPMNFGPFDYSDFPTGVTVEIPEPTVHPLTYQLTVQSYNTSGFVNPLSTSPSTTFVLQLPVAKPASAVAFTRNASGITPATATTASTGGNSAGTGTSYTFLPVTLTPPTNDANYAGTIFIVVDPSGNIWWESGPVTGTSTTLAFPTPTTVGTYTVYACGWNGSNVNPIVPGITPSFTVSLGISTGVVDATQIPITGPLYTTLAKQLNLSLSSDFVVVGGQLQQNAINLALAYGFNTTNFAVSGGSFIVNSIAVSTLIAGNTFNLGTSVFASSASGPYLAMASAGVVMGDNHTTPVNTLTAASTGVTLANSTSGAQLSITASGLTIIDGAGAVLAANAGVLKLYEGSGTTNYVQVNSSGVTVYGNASNYVTVTPSGVTIEGGSLTLAANGITTTLTNATRNSLKCGLTVDDGTNYSAISSANVMLFSSSGGTTCVNILQSAGVGSIILNDNTSGVSITLQPFATTTTPSTLGSLSLPTAARSFLQINGDIPGLGISTFYVALY